MLKIVYLLVKDGECMYSAMYINLLYGTFYAQMEKLN